MTRILGFAALALVLSILELPLDTSQPPLEIGVLDNVSDELVVLANMGPLDLGIVEVPGINQLVRSDVVVRQQPSLELVVQVPIVVCRRLKFHLLESCCHHVDLVVCSA